MKHFVELNYYDLLEIKPTANPVQIQKAYEISKKTFGEESMATYSLFDAASRELIMKRVEEAFAVLSDEKRRHQYDLQLGLKDSKAAPLPFAKHLVSPSTASSALDGSQTPSLSEPAQMPGIISTSQAVQVVNPDQRDINGKFLKQFRERQGIPLQEVADKTRINITYLQFIEQDHFKRLPAEVYLRGYLVQYAKVLGLDPARVADDYLLLYHNWKKSAKAA